MRHPYRKAITETLSVARNASANRAKKMNSEELASEIEKLDSALEVFEPQNSDDDAKVAILEDRLRIYRDELKSR